MTKDPIDTHFGSDRKHTDPARPHADSSDKAGAVAGREAEMGDPAVEHAASTSDVHHDPGVAGTIGSGSGGMTFEDQADTGETVKLKIFRGKGAGIYQTYEIPKAPGMVVLDAVHEVQREQAPDLACRWNCKAGKCGSCSAEINGKPKLMCMTRLEDLDTSQPIRVSPLKAFPVIKDLVCDVKWNYEQNKRITPFTPREMTPAEQKKGEFNMQQMDVDRVQEFRKCIECFLCQDVCHVLRTHQQHDEFAGPRFMIRYAGLDMHPKDGVDRIKDVREDGGIGLCNITKCCTEVCPEHITITDNAIIPMKERVVADKYDPLAKIGKALRGGKRKPNQLPMAE